MNKQIALQNIKILIEKYQGTRAEFLVLDKVLEYLNTNLADDVVADPVVVEFEAKDI